MPRAPELAIPFLAKHSSGLAPRDHFCWAMAAARLTGVEDPGRAWARGRATAMEAPPFLSRWRGALRCVRRLVSPPPVVGIAQIGRSASTGGRLPNTPSASGRTRSSRQSTRRSCASRPERQRPRGPRSLPLDQIVCSNVANNAAGETSPPMFCVRLCSGGLSGTAFSLLDVI